MYYAWLEIGFITSSCNTFYVYSFNSYDVAQEYKPDVFNYAVSVTDAHLILTF